MYGRDERRTPRDEFLTAMFEDDPRLVEMFRSAHHRRRWYQRVDWLKLLAGLAFVGVLWFLWWGFARGL